MLDNKTESSCDRESAKRDLQFSLVQVRDFEKEHDELRKRCANYQRILDLCPGGLPDGTGIMGPEQWIKWARKQLGYEPFEDSVDLSNHCPEAM
jgi:hypothetical protein